MLMNTAKSNDDRCSRKRHERFALILVIWAVICFAWFAIDGEPDQHGRLQSPDARIFALAILPSVCWGVWTAIKDGQLRVGIWHIIKRQEHPIGFWITVTMYIIFGVAFLILAILHQLNIIIE